MNSSRDVHDIPEHLRRYVVSQNYERYSPEDQAVWRFSLRLLKDFLSVHAHEAYVPGLSKTGIDVDRIPDIGKMSEKLQDFGWRAVPVSGFIPPAAFMELQSLGVLPIASDIRSLEHLDYTPAPDIIHEAAGHAPILVDQDFSDYLKEYAQVARKSILHKKDLLQYDAIRTLSDLKENFLSTKEEIENAEKQLELINQEIGETVSEAGLLSRMNWWTAEYGLIGDLRHPKIFGAGLLSSLGESRTCLESGVKKIPLSIDCIQYSYDITEKQPQLFVAEDFHHLKHVLNELAEQLAFRRGGNFGLKRALQSETINSVELDSGLQISGTLSKYTAHPTQPNDVSYLQFAGRCQLAWQDKELPGHGVRHHAVGYGTAVGRPKGAKHPLTLWQPQDCQALGLEVGKNLTLDFDSGVIVQGYLKNLYKNSEGKVLVLTFEEATVRFGNEILFQPEWGTYDLGIGEKVVSVFGGPADRPAFGETDSFAAKVIPLKTLSDHERSKNQLYSQVRQYRTTGAFTSDHLNTLFERSKKEFPNDWLLQLEIYELALSERDSLAAEILKSLRDSSAVPSRSEPFLSDAIRLAPKDKL